MKRIAIIGAQGYIGSAIFSALSKESQFSVDAVTRSSYEKFKKNKYDYIINSAMPAARFWAANNPMKDFYETVKKTADILYSWKFKKLIQISTISARTELDSVYGRHKAAAEKLCDFGDNLIIRLSSTFGDSLKKGALIDIINNRKVYVSGKSRYCFASLEFIGSWISKNLNKKGTLELGAKNSVTLEEIADHFNLKVNFEGRLDVQEVQKPLPEFPDAKEVFSFLEDKINRQ